MDDCWERKVPPRDPATGRLVGDPKRFPAGMKALGDCYHSKGVKYALYTAESAHTCGGYPASALHEDLDAKTFADWGVDYMKVDGCGPLGYYNHGYKAMVRTRYLFLSCAVILKQLKPPLLLLLLANTALACAIVRRARRWRTLAGRSSTRARGPRTSTRATRRCRCVLKHPCCSIHA